MDKLIFRKVTFPRGDIDETAPVFGIWFKQGKSTEHVSLDWVTKFKALGGGQEMIVEEIEVVPAPKNKERVTSITFDSKEK